MKDNEITISKVKPEDIGQICSIAVKAWQGIHDGYRKFIANDDLYERISDNWQQKKTDIIVTEITDNPDAAIVVRNKDGDILGFATFTINEKTGVGEIDNNAVIPECQGQGIGKMLYNHIIKLFKQRGLVYALVTTGYEDEGHAKARAAYKGVGFEQMRTSVTYSLKL